MAINRAYTAVIKQDGPWWIGWIEEVPGVNCQEASREGLLDSLRATKRAGNRVQPHRSRNWRGVRMATVPQRTWGKWRRLPVTSACAPATTAVTR